MSREFQNNNVNMFDPETINYQEYVAFVEAEYQRKMQWQRELAALVICLTLALIQVGIIYECAVGTLSLLSSIILFSLLAIVQRLELHRAFASKN